MFSDEQTTTTHRAARILRIPHPAFLKLLESGVLPSHSVRSQQRVYLRDVMKFAQVRDSERHAALARLSRAAVKAGLYDCNTFPDGGQDE